MTSVLYIKREQEDYVWGDAYRGEVLKGALPPVPPVTFLLQLKKVTKESRRQTSFPLKSDACRLKVLNLPSAALRAYSVIIGCASA